MWEERYECALKSSQPNQGVNSSSLTSLKSIKETWETMCQIYWTLGGIWRTAYVFIALGISPWTDYVSDKKNSIYQFIAQVRFV